MGSADDAPIPAPITVLMLCHRHPEAALESIASLAGERHLIDRILVGDNSCDPLVTSTLDASDLHFNHMVYETNNGFAGGINALMATALATSDANYFLVLNDDTMVEPGCLANLLAASGPDRVSSPMIVDSYDQRTVIQSAGAFDRDLVRYNNCFAGKNRSQVPAGVHEVELTDGCCFLIHRKWAEAGFLMDPDLFLYFEDVDYFLRLRAQDVRFFFVPSAVIQHKKSGSSGGPNSISPLREYYFYRNRLVLAKKLHDVPKRWRVYGVLVRLALMKSWGCRQNAPEAARAIRIALFHFFRGKRGPFPPIHDR